MFLIEYLTEISHCRTDNAGFGMNKIILLGTSAVQIARSEYSGQSENPFIYIDSFSESLDYLKEGKAEIFLVSRDAPDVTREGLSRLLEQAGDQTVCIIRPSDIELRSFIRKFLLCDPEDAKEELINVCKPSEEGNLTRKNHELTRRIRSLEAVVRSLLTALSQYDLSYEAYTGDEDAWKLFMQGMPAAELPPDEFFDDEYDNPDENYDESEGN